MDSNIVDNNAICNRDKDYCLVKLEDADPKSVQKKPRTKATKEWGKRFEHGFSQLVDWFCLLDGQKNTPDFQRLFGHGHIDFVGLLLVGRNSGLSQDDIRRLRWRKHNVVVDSHHVYCMTYDELYDQLKESFELHAAAFTVESNPAALAGQTADVKNAPGESLTPQQLRADEKKRKK